MKFKAEIDIMPLKALLDPQGKAVTSSIHNMGFNGINNIRIGKHISLEVDAITLDEAKAQVDTACQKLLHNPVMEYFEYKLVEL